MLSRTCQFETLEPFSERENDYFISIFKNIFLDKVKVRKRISIWVIFRS